MNREIDYIISVSTSTQLDGTGQWTHSGGLPQTPDEVVVRQIVYTSPGAAFEIYHIDSSLGTLGSVVPSPLFVACPQTRLQLRNPLSQSITFQMRSARDDLVPAWALDRISITLDFVKYKK